MLDYKTDGIMFKWWRGLKGGIILSFPDVSGLAAILVKKKKKEESKKKRLLITKT